MSLKRLFENVVFLTGAGSSKPAGCKLSSEMIDELGAAIRNLETMETEYKSFSADFSEIYNFVLASLSYQAAIKTGSSSPHPPNIEDFVMVLNQLIDKEFVIPYPLIGNWNDKILKWELRDGKIFAKFRTYIVTQLVNSWTKFDESSASALLKPIKETLMASEDFKMEIFTLNYDLVFETLNLAQAQVLETGFSQKDNDEVWAESFDDQSALAKINLYKLHGSVNWEYRETTDEIVIRKDSGDTAPLIIFGSFTKMLSFDPFLYMLSKFREKLAGAAIFIVIGYSFHDKYINNLLIQQLQSQTIDGLPKRMLVVDFAYKKNPVEPFQFVENLQAIQTSKSINDVINFKQISSDSVKIIPMSVDEFYLDYFAAGCKKLQQELDELQAGEKPF